MVPISTFKYIISKTTQQSYKLSITIFAAKAQQNRIARIRI